MPFLRVLLADDDDDARDSMRETLTNRGYDVVAVADGSEALAYLDRDRPSMVVLDLQMDDVSGWEVLRFLRTDPRLRDIPVLVVSGGATPQLPRSVGFLRKPFASQSLVAAVAAALPHAQA
jgi:CheY-like chemotaxis protein